MDKAERHIDWTIGSLIKELSKFPKDTPVRLFTRGTFEDDCQEKISSIGYPIESEEGEPIENWLKDFSVVGIFTEDYLELCLEYLESEGY